MEVKLNSFPPVIAGVKLTLRREEDFFGPGVCELLEKIRETGSIQAAAGRTGMSYSKAWKILKTAEEAMGTKLITRVSGGKNGGSSTLTAAGERVIGDFRAIEGKLASCAEELLREYDGSFIPAERAAADPVTTGQEAGGRIPGFFEAIPGAKGSGLLAAWITEGEGAGAKALFDSSGEIYRDSAFPADLAVGIFAAQPEGCGILEMNGRRIYAERITGARQLVICGTGHVGLDVTLLGAVLGFEVTAIDDREEFAGKAREAGARQALCGPFGETLDRVPADPGAAYVIMTNEHAHDLECARKILERPFAYLGIMGSRSRAEQVRRQLLEEGYDPRKVEMLRMPIGLSIGSRTPEEIAVSVAGELISVMNADRSGEGYPPGMAEELAEAEKTGQPGGVLAIIVEKNGEAPRKPGARMLVRKDGSFLGTIGGGYAEAAVLRTARKMIREVNSECRLMRMTMDKGSMQCGGEITVFLTAV